MAPKEGYFAQAASILGYLKKFSKVTAIIDNSYPDHSKYQIDLKHDWKEFYPDVEEETHMIW